MTNGYFDAPVFILEGAKQDIAPHSTPYFYNDDGVPTYHANLPANALLVHVAQSDPSIALGHEFDVSGVVGVRQTPMGAETQLGFDGAPIRFEPMWATRDAAAAFGITLVEKGQAVELTSPSKTLQQIDYTYGVFAGHWSPYQHTNPNGNTLLSVDCTDLEHHDFPHIFASTDPNFPLVISVGRYWPKRGKIRLADLWVKRGDAVYIPPMPALLGAECVDLHNNRNSARACWGQIAQNSIVTHTLLDPDFDRYHWYWNPTHTVHTNLA